MLGIVLSGPLSGPPPQLHSPLLPSLLKIDAHTASGSFRFHGFSTALGLVLTLWGGSLAAAPSLAAVPSPVMAQQTDAGEVSGEARAEGQLTALILMAIA
ncbi:MAG: hypothetical protein HC812_11280 [Leptolyngbya sp. RL_3_1]|nr:hypothetical protein [Leptolyngbya sp. RL_3_1]